MFPDFDIESMNESDVDGDIVRPFCRALGYSHGNRDALFRTQTPLKYDALFLGHKSKNDPVITGKPDFVCEVVGFSRWVIESKAPNVNLSLKDSQQAYTYAAHPEIAAEFYVLTNGREFRVYRIGNPNDPVMSWAASETEARLAAIENLLGPAAMRERVPRVDLGKPLARNVPSAVRLVGGFVHYQETEQFPPAELNINGMQSTVVDGAVTRDGEGKIVAFVDVKFPFAAMDVISRQVGLIPYRFTTGDEFISSNRERPSLMQHYDVVFTPAGTILPTTPLSPGGVVEIDNYQEMFTQALGFIDGNCFKGLLLIEIQVNYHLPGSPTPVSSSRIVQRGDFEIRFQ
jgi:hypothetical protein